MHRISYTQVDHRFSQSLLSLVDLFLELQVFISSNGAVGVSSSLIIVRCRLGKGRLVSDDNHHCNDDRLPIDLHISSFHGNDRQRRRGQTSTSRSDLSEGVGKASKNDTIGIQT